MPNHSLVAKAPSTINPPTSTELLGVSPPPHQAQATPKMTSSKASDGNWETF